MLCEMASFFDTNFAGSFFMLSVALCVLLCVSWIIGEVWTRIANRGRVMPPGPRRFPIVGCTLQLIYYAIKNKSMHKVIQVLAEEYGPVCYLQLPLGHGIVIVSGHTSVHNLLTSKELNYRPPVKLEMFHSILKGKGNIGTQGRGNNLKRNDEYNNVARSCLVSYKYVL